MKRDISDVREQLNEQPAAQRIATLNQLDIQNLAVITADNAAAFHRHLQGYLLQCMLMQNIVM